MSEPRFWSIPSDQMQSGKMLESSGAGTQPKEMMSKVKCLDGIK